MIMMSKSEIEFIGFNFVPDCNAWVDKNFGYYVIQYAESGELEYEMDGVPPLRLKGPVVWLSFPGPRFRFGRRDGGTWRHRFVSFRGSLADSYADSGLFPLKNPVATISEPMKFKEAFDRLLSKLAQSSEASFRTVHMLEEILLQIGEQPSAIKEEPHSAEMIRKLAGGLAEEPCAKRNWQALAKKSGLSYPHFRRVFLDKFKLPPARFQMRKRMEMGAAELRAGSSKIEFVARTCGFKNIYHFSKAFKKNYGCSPGQYRKRHMPE